ncbi:MAG: hypothetical protein LBE31_09520 [Deltaproteobacteria bacterium]|jgi:septal ring factor EnvC (AmiA/AmiB activator)|nr:hypothetical protein [Deltaproteobacteria bacterium]
MSLIKIILSVLLGVGMVVFLFLWLMTSSDLAAANKQLKSTTDDLYQVESSRNTCEQNLSQTNSQLRDAQTKLTQANSSISSKDQQISSLNTDKQRLQRQIRDLESSPPPAPVATKVIPPSPTAQSDPDSELLNQIGKLAASLETATKERDLYLNQRDEARKTLEAYKAANIH